MSSEAVEATPNEEFVRRLYVEGVMGMPVGRIHPENYQRLDAQLTRFLDSVRAQALEEAAHEDADWTARAWRPEEAETVVKLKKGLLARAKKIREGS